MRTVIPQPELFQGAVSLERREDHIRPWRLPFDRLRLFASPEEALVDRAGTAAGVRLRMRTDSPTLSLRVYPSDAPRLFDLTVDNELLQTVALEEGRDLIRFENLSARDKGLEIWLPNTHPVMLRGLGIEDGAALEPVEDTRPRWVTYGSSISHCGSAHSPARTWPAMAARLRDLHLTCLGYGGNCHCEPMVARVIRDLPADFISLKLGINIHGGTLAPRTFKPAVIGLVRIIREKHPRTPIALISPISCPRRETEPGTTGLTLAMMREEIADAAQRMKEYGDDRLHCFDGRDLFGEELAEDYLPDGLHPNGDGYEIIAKNFVRIVLDTIPFTRA